MDYVIPGSHHHAMEFVGTILFATSQPMTWKQSSQKQEQCIIDETVFL